MVRWGGSLAECRTPSDARGRRSARGLSRAFSAGQFQNARKPLAASKAANKDCSAFDGRRYPAAQFKCLASAKAALHERDQKTLMVLFVQSLALSQTV